MKYLSLLLSAVVALSACQKHDDGPAPGPASQLAAVDLPPECQGQAIDQTRTEWAPYEAAGCTPYGWHEGHFRHGGCPRGSFAACGAGVGMVCVPGEIYGSYQIAWYNYADGNRRLAFCGFEGRMNRGACSYNSIPGAGNIGRACLVGAPHACGPAAVCQPIATPENEYRHHRGRHFGFARVGVCVQ